MPDTMQRVRLVQRHRTLKHCYIFSSNDKCNLDVVGKLLSCLKEKLGIKMLAFKNHFSLSDSTEMCDSTIPDLPMDFSIFVVHADEDRFLFNDDSARIYRALLNATGNRAICVITGDRNHAEVQGADVVLSHWARRQVFPQFSEEFLDGRKSFIFSWDKQHRAIHEEAILHYFDPGKKNKKFVPDEHSKQDKQRVETQERTEADVKHSRTKGNSQDKIQKLPQTEEGARQDMEILSHPTWMEERDENMADEEETFTLITPTDLPEDIMDIMDTSPPQESIAILIRDESDMNTIKEVFGDAVFLSINPVTSRDPCCMKDLLLSQITSVRFCFVIVESTKIKEEFLTNSCRTVYQELLKTANRIVEKKIVVILCNEGKSLTPSEEESITATIKGLLGTKGLVFWCKEDNKTKRSHSLPASNLALSTHVERSINPEEFTLVLKTRLLRGKISYEEKDVKVRLEGWTAPQKMADNLLTEWETINSAELSVYRENKTGKEGAVVRDLESRSKGALGQSGLTSVRERVADGANAIGTEKDEDMADEEVPFALVSPGDLQCLQEDSLPKTEPKRTRAKGMDTSPPQESIAILIRDNSDMNTIKEMFGDVLLGINPVTSRDPRSMKDLLLEQRTLVRSCFIVVESTKLLTKSSSKVYLELLKTANEFVEKKIVVILCSGGKSLTYSEEESITATIKEILVEKVLVFWCEGNNKTKRSSFIRSHSLPEHQKNPEELVLKTRLLRGKISYGEKDVKKRVGEWTAPQEMADSLMRKWQTTESAELAVYKDLKTGNERTVVTEDLESFFKGALGRVGVTSEGANVSAWMNTGASLYGAIRQYGSNLMSGNVPDTEATVSNVSEDSRPEGSSNISSANSNQDLVLD